MDVQDAPLAYKEFRIRSGESLCKNHCHLLRSGKEWHTN